MIRGAAIVLVMLTSLALGHAPCCIVAKQCCDEKVEAPAEKGCCEKCKKEHAPVREQACDCDCDVIVAILVLKPSFEVELAALPFDAWTAEPATIESRFAASGSVRAPPRPDAALSLPLLL
ncbi:MAG: hypothetical protein ACYTHK_07070 [Planctomycetota bacterium]|jgi:hypothetical protein